VLLGIGLRPVVFRSVRGRSWVALLATVATVFLAAPDSAFAARRLLAYVKDSHIWVSKPNGSHPMRLGEAGDQVVMSPDGQQVATVRQGSARSNIPFYVSVYRTAGGAARDYLDTEFQPSVELAGIVGFSADSRYLAVRRTNDVVVLDTATGTIAATLPGAAGASWAPTLPDRLAYTGIASDSPLSIWSSDGSTRQIVSHDVEDPAWGPSRIAFERGLQIWTVKPNGSGLRRVTNVHGGTVTRPFTGLQPEFWSPTGREMVGLYRTGSTSHTCLVSLTTGKQAPILVLGNYVYPTAFNATGTRLLIAFGPSDYAPPGYADRIVTTALSGTRIRTIVKDAGAPAWNL
jgi:hypothetical protein